MKNNNFQLISAILALIEIFFEIKYGAWQGINVLLFSATSKKLSNLAAGISGPRGSNTLAYVIGT